MELNTSQTEENIRIQQFKNNLEDVVRELLSQVVARYEVIVARKFIIRMIISTLGYVFLMYSTYRIQLSTGESETVFFPIVLNVILSFVVCSRWSQCASNYLGVKPLNEETADKEDGIFKPGLIISFILLELHLYVMVSQFGFEYMVPCVPSFLIIAAGIKYQFGYQSVIKKIDEINQYIKSINYDEKVIRKLLSGKDLDILDIVSISAEKVQQK